jgi:hypothetical protein
MHCVTVGTDERHCDYVLEQQCGFHLRRLEKENYVKQLQEKLRRVFGCVR